MTTLQITVPKLTYSSYVKVVTKAVKTTDAEVTVQTDTKIKLVNIETKAAAAVTKTALAADS